VQEQLMPNTSRMQGQQSEPQKGSQTHSKKQKKWLDDKLKKTKIQMFGLNFFPTNMNLDFAIASKTLCCTACVTLHTIAFLQVEKKKKKKKRKNNPKKRRI
jgi:hypothetical protein